MPVHTYRPTRLEAFGLWHGFALEMTAQWLTAPSIRQLGNASLVLPEFGVVLSKCKIGFSAIADDMFCVGQIVGFRAL